MGVDRRGPRQRQPRRLPWLAGAERRPADGALVQVGGATFSRRAGSASRSLRASISCACCVVTRCHLLAGPDGRYLSPSGTDLATSRLTDLRVWSTEGRRLAGGVVRGRRLPGPGAPTETR
jgi:hypothetical protein